MTNTIDKLNTFYLILEEKLEKILKDSEVAEIREVNLTDDGVELFALLKCDETPLKIKITCTKEIITHAK